MENRVFDNTAVLEVFHDDAFEDLRRDTRIPDSIRVDDHDRPSGAYAQTGSFTPLDTLRSEQETFPVKQVGEKRIKGASLAVR